MPIFFLPQLVRYEKLRPARAHHEIGSAVERRLFSEKGMTNLKSNLTSGRQRDLSRSLAAMALC